MATTIWTLLSVFVIAPLGALVVDRPLFGNWFWHIDAGTARDSASAVTPAGRLRGESRRSDLLDAP
jgi:hypothetical protein